MYSRRFEKIEKEKARVGQKERKAMLIRSKKIKDKRPKIKVF